MKVCYTLSLLCERVVFLLIVRIESLVDGTVYHPDENIGTKVSVYRYPVPLERRDLRPSSLISTYPMLRESYKDGPDYYYNYLLEPDTFKPVITNRLAQTKNGINALKIGSLIVVAKLFIGVIILALISTAGIKFAPIFLPLFLLPVGFLTLLFFIPVFIVALILVAIAHNEGFELKRKRRSIDNDNKHVIKINGKDNNNLLGEITSQVEKSLLNFELLYCRSQNF